MTVFVDPIHPYSQRQRIAEFVGCVITAYFGAGFILQECDDTRKIWISLLAVTLPTAIFRKIVHQLFTMPCLLHDLTSTKKSLHFVLLCFADLASAVAYIFTLAWCAAFFIAGTFFWKKAYDGSDSYQCGGAQLSIISEFGYFLYTIAQCKHVIYLIPLSLFYLSVPPLQIGWCG